MFSGVQCRHDKDKADLCGEPVRVHAGDPPHDPPPLLQLLTQEPRASTQK